MAVSLLLFPFVEQVVSRFAPAPRDWLATPYRSHKYYGEGVYFLQRTGLAGNVYNAYWTGGFLGYWRAPRLRTFIDGRTEHYGVDVFRDHAAIAGLHEVPGADSILELLDRRGVDIFFGVGYPGSWHPMMLTPYLERAPGWLLVWRSFRAAIYLRDNSRNRDNLERVGRWYEAQGIPFDPRRGIDPDDLVQQHPDWAVRERLLVPAHAQLVDALVTGDPRTQLSAGRQLSVNYLMAGACRSAVAVDGRLQARFPDEPGVNWRLTWGLMKTGEREQAAMVSRRYLETQAPDPISAAYARLAETALQLDRALAEASPARRWQQMLKLELSRFPAIAQETWAVDGAIETEGLPLRRAREQPRPRVP